MTRKDRCPDGWAFARSDDPLGCGKRDEGTVSDSEITVETIEAAEKLMGVHYTLAERRLMLDNLEARN